MPRFMRRWRPRRQRRRTRWLAIVPGSGVNGSNNSGSQQELAIRDLEGTVQFNDFVGGTLLRVILVVQHEDSIAFTGSFARGYATDHHGIYMTADESPSTSAGAIWDPNIPHGSFMYRWTNAREYYGNTSMFFKESVDSSQHGAAFMSSVDTEVRRRIRENDRLWLAGWHFEDATVVTSTAWGYTGRVLIALP